MLIGAVALNSYVLLPRSTGDVDLAFDLDLKDTEELLRSLGWIQRARLRQRWTRGQDFVADVIPSSVELIERGCLSFEEERSMNLTGFDLVFSESRKAQVSRDLVVEVASLPTISFLKMVAWLDRPHERRKDLNDLGTLLWNYLWDDDERRWGDELGERSFETQGAYLAGLELRRLLEERHLKLVERFFRAVDEPSWNREIKRGIHSPLASVAELLRALRDGIGV